MIKRTARTGPIDWAAVEPHFRAGIRPLRSLSSEFGVTPAAILKHFRKRGVTRDLRSRILLDAQQRVNAALVNKEGNRNFASLESDVINDNANMIALLLIGHRRLCLRARRLVEALLVELEGLGRDDALDSLIHKSTLAPYRPAGSAAAVASLPWRARAMRDLADALHKVVGAEREACGLSRADGLGGGRPTVWIRDFTGR